MVLNRLKPQKVFSYFEEICGIPHGSGNTGKISDYLVNFAVKHGFDYQRDEAGNVIIFAPASKGCEEAEPIIIQGHMDMVCEKEADSSIDFEKDGLDLFIDGDLIGARGTTLGGDDGIAVAYALALLDSPELIRPAIEAVITVDEEVGLLGAYAIDLSPLKGRKLLNIDSETEGEFLTSCAGGAHTQISLSVKRIEREGGLYSLEIKGLSGGHSGAEIHKEHGNANILMGRILARLFEQAEFGLADLEGGTKDNAIPRGCGCRILVPEGNETLIKDCLRETEAILKKEYAAQDPGLAVTLTELGKQKTGILDFSSLNRLILFLRLLPNGVCNMSMQIPGMVETSLNLGILRLEQEELIARISFRSSVGTRLEDTKDKVTKLTEMLGGSLTVEGSYPAWEYKAESALRPLMAEAFRQVYGKEAKFTSIHAGVECGLFSEKLEDLDCLSFGPNIYDIHTPKERLSISSAERVWNLLVRFLELAGNDSL